MLFVRFWVYYTVLKLELFNRQRGILTILYYLEEFLFLEEFFDETTPLDLRYIILFVD